MGKYFKKFKSLQKYSTKLNPTQQNASFWASKYKYAIVFTNRKTLKQEYLFCCDEKEATKEIERICEIEIFSYPKLYKINFLDEYQTPYDKKRKQ